MSWLRNMSQWTGVCEANEHFPLAGKRIEKLLKKCVFDFDVF